MAQESPLPFSSQLSLIKLNDDVFETLNTPQRMGNPLNIAYGGYALAVACKAASLTVPDGYYLYSMLGNYLGPAYTDRQLRASVRLIRQTRTFATRQIEVSQIRDDGEPRVCLIAIADFQVREKGTLLDYSRTPSKQYKHWKQCPKQADVHQKLLDDGKISKQLLDAHGKSFSLTKNLFETRPCAEGIFAQNLYGMAKTLAHSQDDLPLADRTTADWVRSLEDFSTSTDNVSNLAFLLDGAISFLPLSFNHMWFDDVAAVSSLDFALRFFKNDIKACDWHLRELCTKVGNEGRSYGESWIWDEQGRAVACMTQQSILRPKSERHQKL